MFLRQAAHEDLIAVVEVVIAAMPQDPQWNYRFPHREQYPEDCFQHTAALFEYFLNPLHDDWEVVVAGVTRPWSPDPPKIVAFSVWDVSYINKAKHSPYYTPPDAMEELNTAMENLNTATGELNTAMEDLNTAMGELNTRGVGPGRHADRARVMAFNNAISNAKREQFIEPYAGQHLHLQIFGTHPEYTRCGYATRLCEWGRAKATEDNVPLTLLSGLLGLPFCWSFRFQNVGSGLIRVEGEKEEDRVAWYALEIGGREG